MSWVRYPVWPHTFVSPSPDSRGAVVSYWRKYVHEVLVNHLGGRSLPRKSVVRLTDRPNMTLDVYRGCKITTTTTTTRSEYKEVHSNLSELTPSTKKYSRTWQSLLWAQRRTLEPDRACSEYKEVYLSEPDRACSVYKEVHSNLTELALSTKKYTACSMYKEVHSNLTELALSTKKYNATWQSLHCVQRSTLKPERACSEYKEVHWNLTDLALSIKKYT